MMQHSSEKSQANPDVWANGGDSHVMTIEYLRARLLSERTISKAANERADELSKRVKDLEDQLKDVSLQRKRAEKATLDVLSYLESRGVTDLSDLYESESDQEDSLSDTKTVKNNGDKNFGSLQSNENGKESSGSDHESVPSSTGSLSWKGRKKIAQVFEKKYIDSPIRRQISSPLANSSPRRRHGKSCRQIKRRDTRSVVEEPSHDLLKSDVQEYQDSNMLEMSDHDANCLDTMGNKLKQSPEKRAEVDLERSEGSPSFHDRAQAGDASSSNQGNERSGEMERALKHQAQLIGFYEAQEKAQRDWEDKYGDNHASTQDSYEPGSHSDVSHVTEELDENKAGVSLPVEVTGDHDDKLNSDKGVSETNFQTKYSSISHFNSFKLSLDADTGRKDSDQLRETHSSRSPTVDFAFPTVNTSQPQNHEDGQSSHTSKTAFSSDSHPETINENGSIFPHEDPRHSGSILNALQKAKLLLKQQMLGLPKSLESAHREIKPSIPAINNAGFLNVPMASPGLFMVPTDLSFKSPNNSRTLPGSYDYERSSHLYGSHSMSSPVMDSRFMTAGGDTFSSKPRYATEHGNPTRHGLAFQSSPSHASSSKSRLLPYSSSPDLLSSSNQTLFSQLPRSEVGVPPSGIPLFYDHVVQPNVYSS